MAEASVIGSKRALAPFERMSEVLVGLIMVLTITGSLSVAQAGRDDVREMLIGAVGCSLAWGLIDAVLYFMGCLAAQRQQLTLLRAVGRTSDPGQAQRLIADALPPVVAAVLLPAEFENIRQRLQQLPEPTGRARLDRDVWRGALGVFLLLFSAMLPVVLPFVFMHNAMRALRVSNAIALATLFLTGWAYGRCVGRGPWRMGTAMVALGALLVGLTMALGG